MAVHSCLTTKWRAAPSVHPGELGNNTDYVEKYCFAAENLLSQAVLLCSSHLLDLLWKQIGAIISRATYIHASVSQAVVRTSVEDRKPTHRDLNRLFSLQPQNTLLKGFVCISGIWLVWAQKTIPKSTIQALEKTQYLNFIPLLIVLCIFPFIKSSVSAVLLPGNFT